MSRDSSRAWRAAAALREAEVPFMLGGGLAAWARGGPRTDNDVDLFIREQDAERALAALAAVGMRPERPPEEWLLKANEGDVVRTHRPRRLDRRRLRLEAARPDRAGARLPGCARACPCAPRADRLGDRAHTHCR